jgi:hypothetical protein
MHVQNQDVQNLQPTPLEHSYSFPLPERSGDLKHSGISHSISEPLQLKHHNDYHADPSRGNSRYVSDDTWASSERGINNVDMQDSQASTSHMNSSQTPWHHQKIGRDTRHDTASFRVQPPGYLNSHEVDQPRIRQSQMRATSVSTYRGNNVVGSNIEANMSINHSDNNIMTANYNGVGKYEHDGNAQAMSADFNTSALPTTWADNSTIMPPLQNHVRMAASTPRWSLGNDSDKNVW